MNLEKIRNICDKINVNLKNKGLRSVAIFKNSNGKYKVFIKHYDKEILPSFCDNLQKIDIKPYVKQTPTTPSNSGKWIDKPMSPANRHVDGPGALGGPRRIMEIQDLVHTFASERNNMNKIKCIVGNIKRLATLDRIPEIDRLLIEISTMLKSNVYKHILESTRITVFLNDFDNTYNSDNLEKIDKILEKNGIKKINKIRQLIKEIEKLIKNNV